MPYDANRYEQEMLEFWKDDKTFEKSVDSRPENKPYVFYDGPPFATGLPHYGHILSSVIKDVVPRYWTMKGYRVRRRWGWDCHGLPIESLIEKELHISGKKQIEEMGVDVFNDACRSKVLTYTQEWKKMVDRIGRWVEFDTAYKTMDPSYMESVWWALKTIWDKGRIYEGRKVLLYCTRCETPVSKAETTMDNSYKDVTEESAFVKFRVQNNDFGKKYGLEVGDTPVYLVAWTTTPWTLPGNVALAVGPDIEYTVACIGGAYYVVAKERFLHVFDTAEFEVIAQLRGKDLVGLSYEPLFDMPAMREEGKRVYEVLPADFVTTTDGTGIVHTAVIYGEDDYGLGIAHDLPMVPMLDSKGHFTDVAPAFIRGQYLKKAEKDIKKDLEDRGLLLAREQHTHSYPHCWRCDTPLIYNAISAWFIDIQSIKSRLIALNEKIQWYPDHLKHGRFANILETAPDWNISRNRYWATPLPFWKCERYTQDGALKSENDCHNIVCVGSIKELKEKAINFNEIYTTDEVHDMDLHKQHMDQIRLRCDMCGGQMIRVPEVIDCWVEAASMPFAEWHYPFENTETFKKRFPGQYIAEYIAQTRAWFYYMHVIGVLLFDDVAFEHVVTTGTILNEKGEKMSKSKKNYPDPWLIIEQYGMDALRYYLMTSVVMQADNLFFNEREVRDVYNRVVNTLWNVFVFYETYAGQSAIDSSTTSSNILDQWILAKLQLLVSDVTDGMDAYDTVRAGRPIQEFIDELSTWYLRRSRDRFKSDNEEDKRAAIATLREVLLTLSKLMAPFMPFMAEKMYRSIMNGTGASSVHLEAWPETQKVFIDTSVLERMETARQVVETTLALRAKAGVKVRQPLGALQYQVLVKRTSLDSEYEAIIQDELNIKHVESGVVQTNDSTSVVQDGSWYIMESGSVRVKLDTAITPELKKEGLLREVVRTVNQMRKELLLTPSDTIVLSYKTDDTELAAVFSEYADDLKKQVLAREIVIGDGESVTIDGKQCVLHISR